MKIIELDNGQKMVRYTIGATVITKPLNELPETETEIICNEPIDEEKAILAEAIITLIDEIEQLKARLQTLEGGKI